MYTNQMLISVSFSNSKCI